MVAVGAVGLVAGLALAGWSTSSSAAQRASGAPTSFSRDPQYRISVADREEPSLAAHITGLLQARVNSDGSACLWIGGGVNATALTWPMNYSAGGQPIHVFDASGTPVATVGKPIDLGGGHLPMTYAVQVPGCGGFSMAWAVGLVLKPYSL
jgi:hypothetical protein